MRKYFKKGILLIVMFFSLVCVVNADDVPTLQSKIDSGEKVIVLDTNYTEDITISENQNLTIDLNGYSITGTVTDLGSLTIKSSKDGGKLIGNGINGSAVVYVGKENKNEKLAGNFTLESGIIESNVGYGVYCLYGSKAVVNGGTFNTLYSGLTGNNTTGAMYFVVNDGIINTKFGPAIYMPGPVSLDINGGTLNGGISLRMGKLNIAGGIINAAKDNFDSFAEYYFYPGNAWFDDAIYVFGGTYQTDVEGQTNDLEINITGGTINALNKSGAAVAIYDIGKVAQEKTINVSGSAKLISNSDSKGIIDVISLDSAGVKNILDGYNNPKYLGNENINITGGSYSTSVGHFLSSDYVMGQKDGMYVVASRSLTIEAPTVDKNADVKDVTVGVASSAGLKSILEKSLKDSKIDTSAISPEVVIESTNLDKNNIDDVILNGINKALRDKSKDIVLSDLFDISVVVKDSINNKKVTLLTDLSEELEFNILVPKSLLEVKEGVTRTFYIVRFHDGKAEFLDTVNNDGVLSFKSDKFSAYAIAYEDKTNTSAGEVTGETEVKNPATIDGIGLALFAGVFSFVALAGTGYILVKKHN